MCILKLLLNECFLLFVGKVLASFGGFVLHNPINFTYFCSGLKHKQQIKSLTAVY